MSHRGWSSDKRLSSPMNACKCAGVSKSACVVQPTLCLKLGPTRHCAVMLQRTPSPVFQEVRDPKPGTLGAAVPAELTVPSWSESVHDAVWKTHAFVSERRINSPLERMRAPCLIEDDAERSAYRL